MREQKKAKKAGIVPCGLSLCVLLAFCSAVRAIEVLEPGYVVETYASYSCPEMQSDPRDIMFDPYGNLYLTQWENYPTKGAIYRVAPDKTVTKWVDGLGTPRRMVWAGGTDYGEYIYVADGTSGNLLRIDLDGNVSTFCHVPNWPHSLALDRSGAYGGRLYVATREPDHIYYVTESGELEHFSYFPGSISGGHVDMTFDPGTEYGGLMYVTLEGGKNDTGPYGVHAVDPNGSATRFAPAIVNAWNVAIDPHGFLGGYLFISGKWFPEQAYFTLWRADTDGSATEFAVGTHDNHLLTITFGADGAMYVPEFIKNQGEVTIHRITSYGPAEAAVDIKPGSCPNPLNLASRGVLPVAILGTEEFDVTGIDTASIRLEGVSPVRSHYEDVATPVTDGNECECNAEGPDDYLDLTLKFKTQQLAEEIVNSLGEITAGDELVLTLTGALTDGTPIVGEDCVIIVGKAPRSLAARRSDLNEDGIVNSLDFAVLSRYWLESAAPK